MTRHSPARLTLGDLQRGPQAPVTAAEWDVTPGLHEWIEDEIKRREDVARLIGYERISTADYLCESKYLLLHRGDKADAGPEMDPDLADHVALNGPDVALRRCAADRKILAAHPYTTRIINPNYGPHSAGFGCETCHDWDGVPEGRGNCATILALAEAYGLEPAGETDVEVIRG